jgi:hypothetical protein
MFTHRLFVFPVAIFRECTASSQAREEARRRDCAKGEPEIYGYAAFYR